VFYLLLGAPFIAMSQVTVYAGAIMVLFLFVIMLLGAEAIPNRPTWRSFIFPVLLAVILAGEAAYLLVTRARPEGQIVPPGTIANDPVTLQQLGLALFQDYLLPFEVTSILLLVAMVGAIVLIRKEKRVG
jgi:NADH-quinone oxidoreductase subunit J